MRTLSISALSLLLFASACGTEDTVSTAPGAPTSENSVDVESLVGRQPTGSVMLDEATGDYCLEFAGELNPQALYGSLDPALLREYEVVVEVSAVEAESAREVAADFVEVRATANALRRSDGRLAGTDPVSVSVTSRQLMQISNLLAETGGTVLLNLNEGYASPLQVWRDADGALRLIVDCAESAGIQSSFQQAAQSLGAEPSEVIASLLAVDDVAPDIAASYGGLAGPGALEWENRDVRERSLQDDDVPESVLSGLSYATLRLDIPDAWRKDSPGAVCVLTSQGWTECSSTAIPDAYDAEGLFDLSIEYPTSDESVEIHARLIGTPADESDTVLLAVVDTSLLGGEARSAVVSLQAIVDEAESFVAANRGSDRSDLGRIVDLEPGA